MAWRPLYAGVRIFQGPDKQVLLYVQSCTLCFMALVTNSLYQWSLWQVCVYDAAQWDEEAQLLLLECFVVCLQQLQLPWSVYICFSVCVL